jgi:hypothetical protein
VEDGKVERQKERKEDKKKRRKTNLEGRNA